jgi:hypothetical protein
MPYHETKSQIDALNQQSNQVSLFTREQRAEKWRQAVSLQLKLIEEKLDKILKKKETT